ncbi:hypothetical protein [Pleionea sp. CnH1-48]|uniref:hypothetical protein n=1 Tax=Pleionea sp. CnH1-48 TaxID=2954494 RepID=UPI002098278B|nr:hypothetical protein [Pleionea sp. CnH1-48]MCO7225717.1 hypothetical protein [Pleionea sp. CnH1-48]
MKLPKWLILLSIIMSLSVTADSSQSNNSHLLKQASVHKKCDEQSYFNPKESDLLLQVAEQEAAAASEKDKDQKNKKDPSWFDKLVKQHKLGSLHFQDLIELFY